MRLTLLRSSRLRRSAAVLLAAGAVAAGVTLALGATEPSEERPVAAAAPAKRLLYVSPDGSDAGPGSEKRPFKTIQTALDRARPGTAVIVRAGTYPEPLTMYRSGRPEQPIVLRAKAGEKPEITGRLKITGDHVTVSGFVFSGGTPANDSDVLIYVAGGDNVRIAQNEVGGAAQSGVFLGSGSDNAQIVGNWIHDNGKDDFLDHGIYYEGGSGGVIETNVIESNAAYGIHLYPNADGVLMAHNTVVANGKSGIIIGGEDETSDDNVVVNNIVAFNGEDGIRTYWGGPVGTGNVVRDNLVFGNALGNVVVEGASVQGTIQADPGFVDAANRDYHLGPGSAAVGRAVARYVVSPDFDGRSRPQGNAADVGAFER